MKILYSAGNRVGAHSQLIRFLENIDSKHEIKIAAYLKSSESISHINWTLDALNYNVLNPIEAHRIWNLFGHKKVPLMNFENACMFFYEVKKYNPDLIICDGEPIAANIAKSLNIKLWYCSPLHLLDGIVWEKGTQRYTALLENSRKWIQKFPKANKYFIYSPFGDIKFRPFIKPQYKWIKPYFNKIDNSEKTTSINIINEADRYTALSKIFNCLEANMCLFGPFQDKLSNVDVFKSSNKKKYLEMLNISNDLFFLAGETSYLSDAFYNNKNIIIFPSLKDAESLLNAIFIQHYGIGSDLGQIEFMNEFSISELDKSLIKKYDKNYLSIQNYNMLHEEIENEQ